MPHLVQVVLLFFCQTLDAELHEQLFEGGAVEGIERLPGLLAAAHLVHRRLVPRAPGVGEGGPIYVEPLFSTQSYAFPDNTGTPVHYGAEDIESEGPDVLKGQALHLPRHRPEPRFS